MSRPVEISAGGGKWRVLFTHRVLLDIEELTGLNAMQVNLAAPSARLMRAMLFAVLRAAGAPTSLDEAGRLMRPGNAGRIRTSLIDAWLASMPQPDPEAVPVAAESRGEPLSTLDAWAEARYDLNLSDEEWLDMTPRMVAALSARRLAEMRWRELMNGVLCAHTVNHSFSAPKQPTTPRAFMLHPWPDSETNRPVFGEDILVALAGIPRVKVN